MTTPNTCSIVTACATNGDFACFVITNLYASAVNVVGANLNWIVQVNTPTCYELPVNTSFQVFLNNELVQTFTTNNTATNSTQNILLNEQLEIAPSATKAVALLPATIIFAVFGVIACAFLWSGYTAARRTDCSKLALATETLESALETCTDQDLSQLTRFKFWGALVASIVSTIIVVILIIAVVYSRSSSFASRAQCAARNTNVVSGWTYSKMPSNAPWINRFMCNFFGVCLCTNPTYQQYCLVNAARPGSNVAPTDPSQSPVNQWNVLRAGSNLPNEGYNYSCGNGYWCTSGTSCSVQST
jgi:hypothetical protein